MAVKALYQSLGGEVRGHSIEELIKLLAPDIIADEAIIGGARTLDRHYIPSRYPNTTPAGAPAQLYTEAQAVEAIESAREILRFCESHILR